MSADILIAENDAVFMQSALELAREAEIGGDVPVGAVVVKDGVIIGRGKNCRENGGTATCHAEILAINEACKSVGNWRLNGCTLYVTLEPCPMCAGAVAASRISRVVFGAKDQKGGALGGLFDMREFTLGSDTEITEGVCGDECRVLLDDFFTNKRKMNALNRPKRLNREFFSRSAETVAPELLGKILCCKNPESGEIVKGRITETECYLGVDDTASHACHGMTDRNRPMWSRGGTVYVYVCYGMHNMLNIVTGDRGNPQAVLIRAVEGHNGPGRLTKYFGITRKKNEADVCLSDEIWIEDDGFEATECERSKRIGIESAEEKDRERLWRYMIK